MATRIYNLRMIPGQVLGQDQPLQQRSSCSPGCSASPENPKLWFCIFKFSFFFFFRSSFVTTSQLFTWVLSVFQLQPHLGHQGVEGLAVGDRPHPVGKEWHWAKYIYYGEISVWEDNQISSNLLSWYYDIIWKQRIAEPEDIRVLISIPTPRPERANRGSSTRSMYL